MYPLPPMYQPPPPHMYPPPPMYQPPLPHMYPPVPPQLFENQGENVTFFEYIFGQRPQSQRSSQDTSQAEGKLQCACGQDFSTSHTNALHSYSMDLQKTIDSGKKIAGLLQFNGTKGKKMEIQLNNNILFRKTFVEFNMTK
ncbi:hypothetical protein V6N13_109826 [Hibiscus sabdariffa]